MIPSLVLLDRLPLTSGGTVDRAQLPGLDRHDASDDRDARAMTTIEEIAAGVFADVLELDAVESNTNFFEAGGHSIMAARVVSRVSDALGVEIPLRSIFDAPTVADFAADLASHLGKSTTAPVVPLPLSAADATVGAPLSFAQQRIWFVESLTP
jgi:acyl carrier protein